MKVITAEWLEEQRKHEDVCEEYSSIFDEQIQEWKRLFPKGMRLTLTNIKLCVQNNLDIEWLADETDLLTTYDAWEHYNNATEALFEYFKRCSNSTDFEYNMNNEYYREYIQECIRPLWEAIKLDRKSK